MEYVFQYLFLAHIFATMSETQFLPDANGITKRPDVLSVLGILTFLNTGIFMLVYLLGTFGMMAVSKMPVDEFTKLVQEGLSSYPMPAEQMATMEEVVVLLHASGMSLMLIFLVRTIGRFVGAMGIWKGKKQGFYIYAVAQILGLFAPFLILPWSMLGVFGPFMTVGITALYGSQLKRLV